MIFASEADEAVIFARGPSAWFQLVRWDTRHDSFEPGAWIRGTIYPERCDLSPDGRLLLYFVYQGRRGWTSYTSAWTGVSRSPWLTALALWPWRSTWGGGGRFEGHRKVVLASSVPCAAHPDHPPAGLTVAFGSRPRQVMDGPVPGAPWSGVDQRGRVVFAHDGLLIWRRKPNDHVVLADFNGDRPDPQPAPEWATRPLA
ncbi:hypothetical protein E4L96_13120 [Massilia arenosa]|uniref:Uncharacterized protein n=1 Tax=Zemynaea arenosa TaxID=2561931 RepID=A0A4Y9SCP5_9BURK|nr:hypothetical protein E4L96_13120 [Massilia arenosa]